MSGIEAKLSNPLLLCLLLPLATADAVRLGEGEVEREPASSLVHTCTAVHHDEKREERKGTEDKKGEGILTAYMQG